MDMKSLYGYRFDSPFIHNPYLDITTPDGIIDMSATPFDLLGVDNQGNKKKMKAGRKKPYKFAGNIVRETPMQIGGIPPSKGDIPTQFNIPTTEKARATGLMGEATLQTQLQERRDRQGYIGPTRELSPYKQAEALKRKKEMNTVFALTNPDWIVDEWGDLHKSKTYWNKQTTLGRMIQRVPHMLENMAAASAVGDIAFPAALVLKQAGEDLAGNLIRKYMLEPSERYGKSALSQIKEGNAWLRDWYSDPISKRRFTEFVSDANRSIPYRNYYSLIKGDDIVLPSHKALPDRAYGQFRFLENEALVDAFNPKFRRMPGKMASTTVHEGIHKLTFGNFGINLESKYNLESPFFSSTRRKDMYDRYLTDPTEIHARIGELRKHFGLTPSETVTSDKLDEMIRLGLKGKTPVNKRWFQLITDKDRLRKLFNTVPALAPPTIGALAFPQQQTKYKKGGLTPEKAHQMLVEGIAHGRPLTAKQKRYFGMIYGRSKKKKKKQYGGILQSILNYAFSDDEDMMPPSQQEVNQQPEQDTQNDVDQQRVYERMLQDKEQESLAMQVAMEDLDQQVFGQSMENPYADALPDFAQGVGGGGKKTVNPYVLTTEKDIFSEFPAATNLGIWGDKSHQARVSDHNTGDAQDFGVSSTEMGDKIANKLQAEAALRGVKYIIFNRKIWNPSISNSWRPYNGPNPHTDHVHVSYKR